MKLNWKTLFLLTTCSTLGLITSAKAQIIPDNSLGAESSTVGQPNQAINGIPINQIDQINGGARRGGNLFHSFGEFNVNAGRGAYFTNPDGVGNIFTRVTGVNRSNILGTLGVLGNANLFLINPNGIFFGPNASLDVRGSFLGSSANSLLFDNGFEFSATNPQAPPLLTVNIPIGLRFRDNPGNITNQSVVPDITNFPVGLQVNPGNSLALVGGNVSLEQGGSLTAAGGRIELGGLTGAGTVGLQTTGNTFRLNFPTNGLSNVSLLDDARVAVRSNGGGDIAVNANIFTATNGGRLVGGIEGIATRNGGDITVNSNDVSFDGVSSNRFTSGIFNQVQENAMGNTGDINITTKNLSLTNGAEINAITFGRGDAGTVKIQASDISFDGVGRTEFSSGIFSTVQGNAVGNAGGIDITTGKLSLTNGGVVNASTFATGNAGTVKIQARDISFDGVGSNGFSSGAFSTKQGNGRGNAGSIDITTTNLSITNGAQVIVSTFAQGNAGTIKIQASDISLNGVGSTGPSGIFNTVLGDAVGNAGGIDINTGTLSLRNGAIINASTFGTGNAGIVKIQASDTIKASGVGSNGITSSIRSDVEQNATGNAGGIDISTKNLFFTNGAQIIANTLSNGNAGTVKIQASDISFDGVPSNGFTSGIFSNVGGTGIGNAGGIDVTTGTLSLKNGAIINSSTFGRGNAGNISLKVGDSIALTDSSTITTNVQQGGSGIGGNIDIRARSLTLTGGSQIQAGLFRRVGNIPGGIGTGGSIKINASDFIDISGFNPVSGLRSGIFAPAETGSTGPGGSIDITTGAFRLSNFGVVIAGTANGNNGGNITINAKTFEATNGQVQTILSGQAETGRLFSAGDIQLNVTDSVTLKDGSIINSSTSGRGNAGNISLKVGDAIALTDSSFITTNVQQGGSGISGDIDIQGRSLTLTGGSQIQAGLSAQTNDLPGGNGTGGSIKINASDFVDISGLNPEARFRSGIFTPAETGSTGPGGSIDITTGAFRLSNFGIVNAATANGNNGGNITINAKTFEATNGLVQTSLSGQAEAGRLFSAGDIQLNVSDSVSLTGGSEINSSTFGRGNAGNISLQVGNAIALSNSSFISSVVGQGGEGIGGNIDIRGRSLTLTGGSQILTSLFRELNGLSGGKGRAGNIDINATDFVNIFGVGTAGFSSGLFASAERGTTAISPQAAGNINLTTGDFRIADGAVVDALTYNSGDAGNITIKANTFTASSGGQVITTTFNSGSAGNINLNVRDRIAISGSDPNYNQRIQGTFDNQGAASGIFANTASDSTGNGGNITIKPLQNRFPTIAISDGGEVTVASQGQGQGGEISITGNSLTLDRGVLNASTASGDGGNINLRLRNFIRLRNESLISASAGGNGNGGNITINSPFIVAFPRNNDIIANAGRGSGGRVTINATLFGINPLSAEDLRRLRPDDLDPRQLPTSDITAISRDNPSLSVPIQVNSPDVDPSRGLVELPEAVTDPTQKVAENPCRQGIGNEFFVTGRGGLPTTPNQTLNSDNVRVDLLQPVASSGNSRSATKKPATTVTATRVPAQGWIFNDKGQVVLTAYDPTNTDSQRPFSTAAACPAR